MSWCFAWSYKFRKAWSYFSKFWRDIVKNERGFLGYFTLNSALSQIWVDELSLCSLEILVALEDYDEMVKQNRVDKLINSLNASVAFI